MQGLNQARTALQSWGHGTVAILPQRIAPRIVLAVNRPAASTPSPQPVHLRPFPQTSFLHAKKDKGKKGKKGKKSVAEEEEEEEDDDAED
ncbi:unnamed protein product [Discula destructiva]